MRRNLTKLLGLLVLSATACDQNGSAPTAPASDVGVATAISGTGGQSSLAGTGAGADARGASGGLSGSGTVSLGGGGIAGGAGAAADLPVECRGTVYENGFESQDDAGWTHLALEPGLGDPWAHGVALTAPVCHGGQSCWMTGTEAVHATCQEGALVSPALDLSRCAASGTLLVSYWQYLHTEPFAEDTYFDSGRLEISRDDGATWQALPDDSELEPPYVGTCGIHDDGCHSTLPFLSGQSVWADKMDSWRQVSFRLPLDYRTAAFRLRFLFGSDFKEVRRGWLVDDLSIAVNP